MPIYEYECLKCHQRFERLVWSTDKNEPRCDCGGEARKVFSVPACASGESNNGYNSSTCSSSSSGFS